MTVDIGYDLVGMLPRLRRFARAICGSADIADDLVQATCARALAAANSWQPGTRLDAWLFQILRNLWIDRLRRTRVEGLQVDVNDYRDLVGDRGEPVVHARLTLNRVREEIAALPDEQREVLILVCVDEMSYKEAAAILDIPIGTVMSRLARARKRLMTADGGSLAPVIKHLPDRWVPDRISEVSSICHRTLHRLSRRSDSGEGRATAPTV